MKTLTLLIALLLTGCAAGDKDRAAHTEIREECKGGTRSFSFTSSIWGPSITTTCSREVPK